MIKEQVLGIDICVYIIPLGGNLNIFDLFSFNKYDTNFKYLTVFDATDTFQSVFRMY